MRTRDRFRMLALVAATAVMAAGCSGGTGGGGDKAGGAGEPVVLTMAVTASNLGYTPAVGYFLQRVNELSRGGLRIDVVYKWGNFAPNVEEQVVRDVAAGKADLTFVGTRVFDTMNVTSFRALQAPMLIDSYALQDAVIKSDIPGQMLGGLDPIGVVGISVFAASMPKLIAVERPLLSLADWRGITFQAYRSQVQAEAIRALGATPTDTLGGGLDDGLKSGKIQGFAKSLLAYKLNVTEPLAPYVTANVNLWPQIDVLLANPASLARLTDEQRGWLRQAAADAASHSTGLVDREDQIVTAVCQAGARLANASDADLAALRQAFVPVYSELEQDPQTKAFMGQIEALKRSTTAGPPLAIPAGCTGPAPVPPVAVQNAVAASALNGIYRWTITKDDALAHGLPSDKTPEALAQFPTVNNRTLRDGKWTGDPDPHGNGGTYTVSGNRLTFHWGGSVLTFTFSADDKGNLGLTPVLPMDPGDQFVWSTEVWIKIS